MFSGLVLVTLFREIGCAAAGFNRQRSPEFPIIGNEPSDFADHVPEFGEDQIAGAQANEHEKRDQDNNVDAHLILLEQDVVADVSKIREPVICKCTKSRYE